MKTLVMSVAAITLATAASAATTIELRDPGADGSVGRVLNDFPTGNAFSLDGSGNIADVNGAAPPNYADLVPAGTGFKNDPVTVFTGTAKNASNGLFLTEFSNVTFTYLGSEAQQQNFALEIENGVVLFTNRAANNGPVVSLLGDTVTGYQFGPGFLPFAYETIRPGGASRISNNGGVTGSASSLLEIGYSSIYSTSPGVHSINVFFGDTGSGSQGGTGIDGDLDDLGVRIDVTTAVPLPAGVWMLVTALGGVGFLSRRRRAQALAV